MGDRPTVLLARDGRYSLYAILQMHEDSQPSVWEYAVWYERTAGDGSRCDGMYTTDLDAALGILHRRAKG